MSDLDLESHLVTFLKNPKNFPPSTNDSSSDIESDQNYEHSPQLHDHLQRLFLGPKIGKYPQEIVADVLNTNLNTYFVQQISWLVSLRFTADECSETQCLQLMAVIEGVFDYLKAQSEGTGCSIRCAMFGEFFLATLKVSCSLFGYLKEFMPSSAESRLEIYIKFM